MLVLEFVEISFQMDEGEYWNEDDEFPNFTLKKISSTVTAATHPYICGGCGDYVSEHTDGKCQGCDAQDWQLR